MSRRHEEVSQFLYGAVSWTSVRTTDVGLLLQALFITASVPTVTSTTATRTTQKSVTSRPAPCQHSLSRMPQLTFGRSLGEALKPVRFGHGVASQKEPCARIF
jgi:hypothetical protein